MTLRMSIRYAALQPATLYVYADDGARHTLIYSLTEISDFCKLIDLVDAVLVDWPKISIVEIRDVGNGPAVASMLRAKLQRHGARLVMV